MFCVGLYVPGEEAVGHKFFIFRGRHDTWYVFIFLTFWRIRINCGLQLFLCTVEEETMTSHNYTHSYRNLLKQNGRPSTNLMSVVIIVKLIIHQVLHNSLHIIEPVALLPCACQCRAEAYLLPVAYVAGIKVFTTGSQIWCVCVLFSLE